MMTAEQIKYSIDIEKAIEKAEEDGYEVVRSTETTLLLDLDDKQALDTYMSMYDRLHDIFGLSESARWKSKSGVGVHVVCSCNPMEFPCRAALQSCLGSDKLREALSIARHSYGVNEPSVLFKPAGAR